VPSGEDLAYAPCRMAFSRLGRLLDVEWMLKRDEARPSADVARHDRELLRGKTPRDPEQALDLWLAARRRELDDRTLGIRVSEMLTALHVILVVLAWAAGAGTAKALLHDPSARDPTNLLSFLFATLVWPLLLLLGSALSFALRGRFGRSVVLEDLYIRLLGALGRLTRSRAHEDWDLAHEWRKLRRSARRYRDIELGTLLSSAQWYPLSFHLGAACTLLASALFTDLAFAWSTTGDSLEPDVLASVFRVVTAPWCATLDLGCVTPELVRATQFSRFTGQYALPAGAALSGAWWPALLACLLLYGVLPRLVFALGLGAFVRSRAAHASERVLELRGRLLGGVDVISARLHPQPDGADPAPEVLERRLPEQQTLQPCWVIRWRGAAVDGDALASLCAGLGLRALRQDDAGGSDFSHDDALLEASRRSSDALVLVVEGWEAPDKATRRFVQALRQNGPSDRPIFVSVLLEHADAPELALWRDRLRLLEDPYVSVRALVALRRRSPLSPEVG
jgi:uncharacterized protein DUF2868